MTSETKARIIYAGDPRGHRHELDWYPNPEPRYNMIVLCSCGQYFQWRYPLGSDGWGNTWVPVRWWNRSAWRLIRGGSR